MFDKCPTCGLSSAPTPPAARARLTEEERETVKDLREALEHQLEFGRPSIRDLLSIIDRLTPPTTDQGNGNG